MARPRSDGSQPKPTRKHKLTDAYVRNLKPEQEAYLVWDQKLEGFCVQVQPSGYKAFKCIYRMNGKVRWYTIGSAGRIDFDAARTLAVKALLRTITGVDVAAERAANRGVGTFEEIAKRYLDECAKIKNRSWKQSDALVQRFLLPRWGKLHIADISRSDVKLLLSEIKSESVKTQTKRAASAIFVWCIKEEIVKTNPCQHVVTKVSDSRERVLSDTEIPRFWGAFDNVGYLQGRALKLCLLLGQRSGEVLKMRNSQIVDGWWELPSINVKTKRNHRIWLPTAVRAIIAEFADCEGLWFANTKRGVIDLAGPMAKICKKLGAARATPHDLRRSHGTKICALGFGRACMDRIQNHADGGIGSVYDRHTYSDETKRVMEAVASHIMALVEPTPDNVVPLKTKTA